MGELSKALSTGGSRFDGSFLPTSADNFRIELFGEVARVVWAKPDTVIATIAGVSDRAARDYLSGKVAVPSCVVVALLAEITRRR